MHLEHAVEENTDDEDELTPPKLKTIPEAISGVQQVHHFLEHQGHTSEATETMQLISSLTALHYSHMSKATRQTTLFEHFTETFSHMIRQCKLVSFLDW